VKTIVIAFILMLAMAADVKPARAGTDYLCLKNCINSGKHSSICLPQCSYNDTKPPEKKPNAPIESPNREFNAPEPSGKIILPPPPRAAPPPPEKNVRCVLECAQNGLQYRYCEKTCASQPTR